MATDGHIESVHQVADGEVDASLGDGKPFLTCGPAYFLSFYPPLVLDYFYSLLYDRQG